jgi:GNAT superfamily N-acetyltransferase
MSGPWSIRRYLDVGSTPKIESGLDAIFFESSDMKSFGSEGVREAFRERWLGRYLKHDPKFAYLVFAAGVVVGYLVGAVDDPALAARFADLDYFAELSGLTKRFPGHLHVNVAPDFRDRGIGGRLVDRFVADAKAAGAPGVHVITSAGAPNVRFYNRNGFLEVCRAGKSGQLVFLARALR